MKALWTGFLIGAVYVLTYGGAIFYGWMMLTTTSGPVGFVAGIGMVLFAILALLTTKWTGQDRLDAIARWKSRQ